MTARQAELAAAYGIAGFPPDEDYPPEELFPKTPSLIVRTHESGRIFDVMPWGVPTQVPGKRIDQSTGKPMMLSRDVTNVRNLSSPFWRSMLTLPSRRCLVPVTSFSEYGQEPGADGKKPLFWFQVPSRPIFSFAGIWRPTDQGARFAFLTTEPNPIVGAIHPKAMPVILDEADYGRWLSDPWQEVAELVAPYPSQLMTIEQHVEEM